MSRALVAASIGILLSLALAELALRTADAMGWVSYWTEVRTARENSIWQVSSHANLQYVHRAHYAKDGVSQTEASGILRPDDVAREKPAGTLRVALLGDSVSAALELRYADRFASLIEHGLNEMETETHRDVQVLNFGVNGYTTQQEATLLETHVATFEPDLLVVQYSMNDLRPSETPLAWFQPISLSHLIAWVDYQIDRWSHLGYPPAEHWERAYREDESGWRQVTHSLGRIATWAEERSIPVLLAIVPVLSHEGWRAGDAVRRHQQVADAGRAVGMNVLDLLPVLESHPVDELRPAAWDTFHLNEEGHRLVARALGEAVRDRIHPATSTDATRKRSIR